MKYTMTASEYSEYVSDTAIYEDTIKSILHNRDEVQALLELSYLTSGLAGEAGEVSEKFKKRLRDGIPQTADQSVDTARALWEHDVALELGDVLWYIAAIGSKIGYSLEEMLAINYNKLQDRKRRKKLSGSGDHR